MRTLHSTPYTLHPMLGFTMVELLVVMGIMGILFAIAIPTFGNYERNARVRHTAQELRSLLWDAQAFSLAPSDVAIESYGVIFTKGVGDMAEITVRDDAGEIAGSVQTRKGVYIEEVLVDSASYTTATLRFLTGNRRGGNVELVDIRDPNNLDDDVVIPADTVKIVVGSDLSLSKLKYEIVVDMAKNSIVYDRSE